MFDVLKKISFIFAILSGGFSALKCKSSMNAQTTAINCTTELHFCTYKKKKVSQIVGFCSTVCTKGKMLIQM